jgi:cobalamin biosynthesis protein CobD/CbiB
MNEIMSAEQVAAAVEQQVHHIRRVGGVAVGCIALTTVSFLIWFISDRPFGFTQVLGIVTVALSVWSIRKLVLSLRHLAAIRRAPHDDV